MKSSNAPAAGYGTIKDERTTIQKRLEGVRDPELCNKWKRVRSDQKLMKKEEMDKFLRVMPYKQVIRKFGGWNQHFSVVNGKWIFWRNVCPGARLGSLRPCCNIIYNAIEYLYGALSRYLLRGTLSALAYMMLNIFMNDNAESFRKTKHSNIERVINGLRMDPANSSPQWHGDRWHACKALQAHGKRNCRTSQAELGWKN